MVLWVCVLGRRLAFVGGKFRVSWKILPTFAGFFGCTEVWLVAEGCAREVM